MELRDLVGWLLLGVAVFTAVAGAWAAWYFAHHRVYARQLRRERRARREAHDSGPGAKEGLARIPSQPAACDTSPKVRRPEDIPPIAGPGFQPDPTLTRFAGVFSAPAERARCSFAEAERFDMQTDRQPKSACEIVQAISIDPVGSGTLLFAPVASGPGVSSPQSL